MRTMAKLTLALTVLVLCLTVPAVADPFTSNVATDVYGVAQGGAVNGIPTANDDNDGVPDIHDAVNLLLGTTYARNYQVDSMFVQPDYVWKNTGGAVALIGLTAGNSNTLGVYTDIGVGAAKTPILGPFSGFGFTGDGSVTSPYPAAMLGLAPGANFGWYLDSSGTNYYSESGLNAAGFDHMMTFDLPGPITMYVDYGNGAVQTTLTNPYLIGWEDLPYSNRLLGDEDYDDMMYLVDLTPVPAPGAVLLGILGLGAAGAKLRRRRA